MSSHAIFRHQSWDTHVKVSIQSINIMNWVNSVLLPISTGLLTEYWRNSWTWTVRTVQHNTNSKWLCWLDDTVNGMTSWSLKTQLVIYYVHWHDDPCDYVWDWSGCHNSFYDLSANAHCRAIAGHCHWASFALNCAQCGAYCECHLCGGDAWIQWSVRPCILYFGFLWKRHYKIDIMSSIMNDEYMQYTQWVH